MMTDNWTVGEEMRCCRNSLLQPLCVSSSV